MEIRSGRRETAPAGVATWVRGLGVTFGAWQRQARLLRALELLGTGMSVGDVAFSLGYIENVKAHRAASGHADVPRI